MDWSRQVGHSVFVSSPVLMDVNLDGMLEVVALPFTDDVTVIDARTGSTLPHTVWPRVIPATSYHASPLMVSVLCATNQTDVFSSIYRRTYKQIYSLLFVVSFDNYKYY